MPIRQARGKQKIIILGAVVLGILFVGLAYVYWTTPANALPSYLPGFDSSLTTVHVKHGVAALLLGLAAFAYAWFGSAKKNL